MVFLSGEDGFGGTLFSGLSDDWNSLSEYPSLRIMSLDEDDAFLTGISISVSAFIPGSASIFCFVSVTFLLSSSDSDSELESELESEDDEELDILVTVGVCSLFMVVGAASVSGVLYSVIESSFFC